MFPLDIQVTVPVNKQTKPNNQKIYLKNCIKLIDWLKISNCEVEKIHN